jgi:hypothetical protein
MEEDEEELSGNVPEISPAAAQLISEGRILAVVAAESTEA